jgi:hypothetical protein
MGKVTVVKESNLQSKGCGMDGANWGGRLSLGTGIWGEMGSINNEGKEAISCRAQVTQNGW